MSNVSSGAVNEDDEHFAHGNAKSLEKNVESSSSPSIVSRVPWEKCLCDLEAPMKTSLTKDNYDRRFIECANCRVDKEVCQHCRRVMWRLREKEDELESEAKLREFKYKAEIAQYKNAIGIELAKLSLQLDLEKCKYSTFEKNFRMTLAICFVLTLLLLLCGSSLREQGYCSVEKMMLP